MKKTIGLIILLLVAGIIAIGVYLNDVDDNENVVDKPEEETVKKPEIKVPEEPFFDYEETNLEAEDNATTSTVTRKKTVKAIYFTSYSASSESKIQELIQIASTTEINAVVIDINNFSGKLAYDSDIPVVNEYNLDSNRIRDLEGLVERLNGHGIYTIARVVTFQNTALAEARPDFALRSSSTERLWYDSGDQAWLDPSSEDIWRYTVEVSREISSFGFDEINFDYIRFPSDGDLDDIVYPVWDKESFKTEVLSDFFQYLDKNLPDARLSIDVFGLTTVSRSGVGIGQLLEDVYANFDVVAPMVYPSHYANGSFGIQNPAAQPYEIILVSLTNSVLRLPNTNSFNDYKEGKVEGLEIRPWLQDFDLGANYGPEEIRVQIKATQDVLGEDAGFMLWNPRNVYTIEGLRKSNND